MVTPHIAYNTGEAVTLRSRRVRLAAFALTLVLAACAPPATQDPETAGEPHDQSAFARDPAETHVMSPDESDLHPTGEGAGT